MKVIKIIKLTKKGKDITDMGIPKGAKLFVIWIGPKAPFGDNHQLLKVRIDNGTEDLSFMPEAIVRDTEINFKEVKK